jgi:fructose-bisphosphate aldolase class I
MDIQKLNEVAKLMVMEGKGILAADESTGTIAKRFEKIAVENTEDNRRAYREMLFTTPKFGEYISGVIMYDETFRQSASTGEKFTDLLVREGALPGIKVDMGTEAMADSPDEKLTKGIDGLPARLAEYAQLGAKFAKWRAVITIKGNELPTDANLEQNALDLATYARMCQEAGIVPIVEPEVIMDGPHTQARCEDVSERTLTAVFNAITEQGVALEGMILKTNMVVPGTESGEKASPAQVADATLRVFNKILPKNLPGQAFLSGGQSEVEATMNLNEMNKRGPHPWKLSFSYGRALQDSALKTWAGKPENVAAAQQAFLKRAQMNSLATLGKYEGEK